ncbi:MAG: DUF4287 domain-containing protein [Thermoanaerobaculia bacterium]|jgi:hypothetical protein
MTFQAYLDNIRTKTGKTPDDFFALAKKKGIVGPELTATRLVAWLRDDFGLGHGHSMAIWTVFKEKGWAGGTTRAAAPAKAKRSAK